MKHWFDESNEIRNPNGTTFLNTANKEAMVMDLTVKQYNGIFYRHLSQIRYLSSSIPTEVHLGGIIRCSLEDDHVEYLVEIAILPDIRVVPDHRWCGGRSQAVIMKDGRSRHHSSDVFASTIQLHFWDIEFGTWTSQASHIFRRLGIKSNLEDYVVVNSIYFEFTISVITTAPKGFLFLCPAENFQTGPSSFVFPDCPAYWSLDPLGIDKLNTADAASLGFPSIRLSMKVKGKSWDTSLYAGLRHFHLVKGFDPDSQDVARHLGHPLYRLSREMPVDVLFAHIDDAEHDLGPGPSDGDSDVTQKAHDNVPLYSRARRHQAAELHGGPSVSETSQIFMKVQLMLILFLALSALYTEFG
ncbi:hypothetical protein DFH08DRAFT_419984 [Mycena albidolilacea]|uniref:Uncharacterized protein n=1 Tax=Mycena albidolilacea TaxID=1033008 RepID=A0AAD6ZCW7_9AGAR|nr:hypothetical protein DFH08DRAFT_419984 [Mycena albidolilacea]